MLLGDGEFEVGAGFSVDGVIIVVLAAGSAEVAAGEFASLLEDVFILGGVGGVGLVGGVGDCISNAPFSCFLCLSYHILSITEIRQRNIHG